MRILTAACVVALLLVACQDPTSLMTDPLDPTIEQAAAGYDKPMLPAYKLPHERFPNKADSFGDYKSAHPEVYGITVPPAVHVRPLGEFEPAANRFRRLPLLPPADP